MYPILTGVLRTAQGGRRGWKAPRSVLPGRWRVEGHEFWRADPVRRHGQGGQGSASERFEHCRRKELYRYARSPSKIWCALLWVPVARFLLLFRRGYWCFYRTGFMLMTNGGSSSSGDYRRYIQGLDVNGSAMHTRHDGLPPVYSACWRIAVEKFLFFCTYGFERYCRSRNVLWDRISRVEGAWPRLTPRYCVHCVQGRKRPSLLRLLPGYIPPNMLGAPDDNVTLG